MATYGQLVKAEKVRLVPEQLNQNDCEIILNGEKRTYEITEVMEEGRKRRDEYKGKLLRNRRKITDKLKNGVKLGFILYLIFIKDYRHGHDDAYAIC